MPSGPFTSSSRSRSDATAATTPAPDATTAPAALQRRSVRARNTTVPTSATATPPRDDAQVDDRRKRRNRRECEASHDRAASDEGEPEKQGNPEADEDGEPVPVTEREAQACGRGGQEGCQRAVREDLREESADESYGADERNADCERVSPPSDVGPAGGEGDQKVDARDTG